MVSPSLPPLPLNLAAVIRRFGSERPDSVALTFLVENALYEHPGILEVATIGVPDERWGETVKAIVVPRDGVDLDPAEIIEFCRGRLAKFKCPTSVDFVDAVPRNASGKILKTELRAPYWAGHDRHIS